MAETTDSWTVEGVTVVTSEDAQKIVEAAPEEVAAIIEILRADETVTPAEAIALVVPE